MRRMEGTVRDLAGRGEAHGVAQAAEADRWDDNSAGSSRSSAARSRRHKAPTSSGNVEGSGFSSAASSPAALSRRKSSCRTRCESSST